MRQIALRDAGARRLLTPEELAHKTLALTGFKWQRYIDTGCYDDCQPEPSGLTRNFRLIYGGIDSDGITERARNVTSVMAGVAKRHATQTSCSVVMRELYLVPDEDRRLFGSLDRSARPNLDFGASFEIEAGSRAQREVFSLVGLLPSGPSTVKISFINDWAAGRAVDRNVFLDRLDLRDTSGRLVVSYELEAVEPEGDCKGPRGDSFGLFCNRSLHVPIEVPTAGHYTIEVVAWADQAGDELARMDVAVLSAEHSGGGAIAIRSKLVELHEKLLGIEVSPYSRDVDAAFELMIGTIERGQHTEDKHFNPWDCGRSDMLLYDGILDNTVRTLPVGDGNYYYELDWDRINSFLGSVNFGDFHYTARAWVVVLAYLLMDYRYLYL